MIVHRIDVARKLVDLMQNNTGQPASILRVAGRLPGYRVQCNGIGYEKLQQELAKSKYKALRELAVSE